MVEPGQYTSGDYAALARANDVVLSVGLAGECWDCDAVAESFFATIKRELIDTCAWPTRAGLRTAIFDYIEGWSRYVGDPWGFRAGRSGWVTWPSHRVSFVPTVMTVA